MAWWNKMHAQNAQSTRLNPQGHKSVNEHSSSVPRTCPVSFLSFQRCHLLESLSLLHHQKENTPCPKPCPKATSFPLFLEQGMMVNISPNPRLRECVTHIASHWENALSITAVPIFAASWQSVPLQSSYVSLSRRVLSRKSLSLLISFLLARLLCVQICRVCSLYKPTRRQR